MLRHLSQDETTRLQTLKSLQILDETQDHILDTITAIVCQMLDMPNAMVTLLTAERQHILSKIDFPVDETRWEDAFCKYTVQQNNLLVCEDTHEDERFRENPFVTGAPHIRFYAGMPIKTLEGYALGSFCVVDYKPRTLNETQQQLLRDLSEIVMSLMASRNAIGFIDAVTLLPNRQRLIDDIEKLTKDDQEYLLILIDTIDISYAYEMGRALGMPAVENVLKDIGAFLRMTFHNHERVYCAATGRFALLINISRKESTLATLRDCAARIQQSVISHVPIKLDMFVGYTSFNATTGAAQEVLRKALSALHDAIAENIPQSDYQLEADIAKTRAFTLISDLGEALRKNEGLYLVYQPKIELRSRKVVGAEALIRWKHPVLGNVSPAQFIPLAENTTLIRPLTDWVIDNVARQINRWKKKNLFMSVSINITANNLSEGDFAERLMSTLQDYELTAADIEIECLETQKILESNVALTSIAMLKRLGFLISLDDFGSGYSNLTYLNKIPIDIIKIDKSLIDNINKDTNSRVIIKSLISMLHKLHYVVLAEGVEDQKTIDYLVSLGCDQVQGYHLSRPLMPAEFARWCENHDIP